MLIKINSYIWAIILFLFCVNSVLAKKSIQSQSGFSQQTYIKAANTGKDDVFGTVMDISGDTMVVGAWGEASNTTGVNGNSGDNSASNSGAVYVFVLTSAGFWTQQAYLKASNTDAKDNFGSSVAIFGDTIVVGARYEGSSATGINGDENNNLAGHSGAVYVFARSGSAWSQQAYIKASNTEIGDNFGTAVAIYEDTIVVGARAEDSSSAEINGVETDNLATESGAAYVFTRNGTTWSQQAYLKASNTDANDTFGVAVAIAGDTVAVGALFEDSNARGVNGDDSNNSATDSGAAYIFTRTGNSWSQQAYIKAANADEQDFFAGALDISQNTLLVSAVHEDSNARGVNGDESNNSAGGRSSGAAYVFTRTGNDWTQQAYLKASNTGREDWFGHSVAILDDELMIGARLEDSNATGIGGDEGNSETFGEAGAVYFFTRTGSDWAQSAYLKASNTGRQDFFGISVAISAEVLAVGASYETSNSTGINGNGYEDREDSIIRSGAVYTFSPEGIDLGLIFTNGFEK